MKNMDEAIFAVGCVRSRSCRGRENFQAKFVDWILDNEDKEFTVKQIARVFDVEQGRVSSSIRNMKEQYGFVFSREKKSSLCNHGITYKLIDCKYNFDLDRPISKEQQSSDLWKAALGIQTTNAPLVGTIRKE